MFTAHAVLSHMTAGLNVTSALCVAASLCERSGCFCEMLLLCLSVLFVYLPLLSWRALLHPAATGTCSTRLLLHNTQTWARTNTSTISWDKQGLWLPADSSSDKKKSGLKPRTDRGTRMKERLQEAKKRKSQPPGWSEMISRRIFAYSWYNYIGIFTETSGACKSINILGFLLYIFFYCT